MNQTPNIEETNSREHNAEFKCFHCKDTGWNLDSQYAEFCVYCDYKGCQEEKEIEKYRTELAKICKLSGIQMCPGCGLTPKGLDILIHHQLQKARYDERHSLLTTIKEIIKAMSRDGKNETPEAIRILKELYDLLSKPDSSELDQDSSNTN